MQKKVKSKLSDALFILICLFGSAFCLWEFFRVFNRASVGTGEPIARIEFKRKTAQRKLLDDLIWDRLRQNSSVYNGDTIRTAEQSEAKLYFGDGSEMDLQESTMVQITRKGGVTEVAFQGGQISVQSGSGRGMLIRSGDSVVSLDGSSRVALNGEGGAVSVSVQSGRAVVESDGSVVSFAQGESLIVSADGQVSRSNLTVSMPSYNQTVLNLKNGLYSMPFSWHTETGDDVLLEVSATAQFSETLVSQVVPPVQSTRYGVMLEPGTYWWRITTVPPGAETGAEVTVERAEGKFKIVYSPPPELVYPKDGYQASYHSKLPSTRFSWEEVEAASSYQFEIATNAQMLNPIVSKRVPLTASSVSNLGEGTYYWRVTPYYAADGIGLALPSEVRTFTISQSPARTEAPELQLPAADSAVNTRIPLDGGTFAYKVIYFSWNTNPEASSYTFTLYEGDSGTALYTETTRGNYLMLDTTTVPLQTGACWWQVSVTDMLGNTATSERRRFYAMDADFEQRTLFPPDSYHVMQSRAADLRYSWKTNVTGRTTFEIARDRSFSDMVRSVPATGSTISGRQLDVGQYYWRISSAVGGVVLSTPGKLLVVEDALDAPLPIDPPEGERIVIYPGTPYPLEWSAVSGADYYRIQILSSSGSELIDRNYIESAGGASISLPVSFEALPEGDYQWTIQAIREESSLWSKNMSRLGSYGFRIRKLQPITLVSPENHQVFDGVQAFQQPSTVSWSSAEVPAESEIVIYRGGFLPQNVAYTFRNAPTTMRLPRLVEGTYWWNVRGTTDDGLDITSTEARSFTVTPVPPLPAPKLDAPKNNASFDTAYFRSSRIISFKWNPVEGADRYLLSLYDNDGEVFYKTYVDKDTTQCDFADLPLLDGHRDGIFWSVEAQSLFEGEVFQHGQTDPYTFTINLPSVRTQTRQRGEMYGN